MSFEPRGEALNGRWVLVVLSIAAVGWALLLALAVAYASPLALLQRSRIREQLRTLLADAGIRFETAPPVATLTAHET